MRSKRNVEMVNGGRRGIGIGIERDMDEKGFDMEIKEREREEEVIKELRGIGGKVDLFKSDIDEVKKNEEKVFEVMDELGGIDCMVNNEGMGEVERGDFIEMKNENLEKIMDVKMRGKVFLKKEVVKEMMEEEEVRFKR